jgi:hypothetical protein
LKIFFSEELVLKITSIKPIEPKISRCISVDAADKLFAVGNQEQSVFTHNSVAQQNIIISCLLRPKNWVILGIDLKRVELSRYREFGMSVATDLETAIEFLRFGQAVMMKRYEAMEELGINNFLDLPGENQALLIMVDEAGELLSPTGAKAVAFDTIIPTVNGNITMEDLNVGDIIYDKDYNPTEVLKKYEPFDQDQYEVTIKNSAGEKETFIAGSEHYWVVSLQTEVDNSTPADEILIDTQSINAIVNDEKATKKTTVKITRRDNEIFEVIKVKLAEEKKKLYCISVDSPNKQFLIGEIGCPTHNTEEAKAADELKGEAIMIIGSIARLGRASAVFLVVATQRPDAKIIPGEVRDNFAVRVGCGTLLPSASAMILNDNIGARIRSNPKGGIYIKVHNRGNMGQGFFAPNEWLKEYYERTNSHPTEAAKMDGIPDSVGKEKQRDALDDWDEDMEDLFED